MQLLAYFDLDNTLIDRQRALSVWLREFCISHSLDGSAEMKMAEALASRAYPEDFVKLRQQVGLAESASDLWQAYITGIAERVSVRPGVAEGLARMRGAGWRLAIVTNGASDIQRAKLRRSGLSDAVDVVCISDEVGPRKPSPEIFQIAARRCGLSLAGGGWMVGDNPETDVAGGRAAGLWTMWIAAGRQWPAEKRRPDGTAMDVSAAIAALLAWGANTSHQASDMG